MYDENESLFCEALAKDLRKPKQEALSLEVEFLRNDVRGCLNNLSSWVQDHNVEKNIVTLMDSTYLHPDPLGVVLILGAWNYPLQVATLHSPALLNTPPPAEPGPARWGPRRRELCGGQAKRGGAGHGGAHGCTAPQIH